MQIVRDDDQESEYESYYCESGVEAEDKSHSNSLYQQNNRNKSSILSAEQSMPADKSINKSVDNKENNKPPSVTRA